MGNASFDVRDDQIHMSKVEKLTNCSGVVSVRFFVDDIKEIIVKKPYIFGKGYIQFVLKENTVPEIKGLCITDFDRVDISELIKTMFSRSQAEIILSFADFISDNWGVRKTVL